MKRDRLRIRAAQAADAPALAALLRQLGFPAPSRPALVARLRSLRGAALVAERDGRVVGLVTLNVMPVLHRPTAVGRMSALVVDAGERRRGVGRALVAAAEQALHRRGCALVEVTSNLRLKRAHAFYRHLGYEATSLRFKKALSPSRPPPPARSARPAPRATPSARSGSSTRR